MADQNEKKTSTAGRWIKYLAAVVVGNGLYFYVSPYLPPAARHQSYRFDLGTLVDLWFCLFIFGVMELASFLRSRLRS